MCDCDYLYPSRPGLPDHYDNCKTKGTAGWVKNEDGTLALPNKNLKDLEVDLLYHLGLDTKNYDLPKTFGDVKFVCMGGTKHRMREFAKYMTTILEMADGNLINLTKHSQRYAMYKVGPVLSVSHGIGNPSMTILLQEILKLLYYARAKQPIIFRIGTSGGLAVPPGSVVISSWGINGILKKSYDIPILGEMHSFPAFFDQRLAQELLALASPDDDFRTFIGGTMAADDFYRGQARLDGPFCHYTAEQKMTFLKSLQELGVKNIEMEATAFAAMTKEAGVRSGEVCATLIDRTLGDQVTPSKATSTEWQKRPMIIVGRYISNYYYNVYKK